MSLSPSGCLTIAGVASAVAIGAGGEAQATSCTTPIAADECIYVTSYSASCTINGTTYGSGGVCSASISAAISTASGSLTANPAQRVLVIVGNGTDANPVTYDLSQDLSTNPSNPTTAYPQNPPFKFSSIKPVSDDADDVGCDNATLTAFSTYGTHGCLIIAGNSPDSTGTTIVTSAATGDISLTGVSHLAFENLTFVKQVEGAMGGTLTSVGTASANGTSGYATLTFDVLPNYASEETQDPSAFASVASIGNGQYADGDILTVQDRPTSCTTPITLQLSVSQTGTKSQASVFPSNSTITVSGGSTLYTSFNIGNVLSSGNCSGNSAVAYGAPVAVSGGHGTGMMVTVSPHPSPLSIFNHMINSGGPAAYMRAYNFGTTPSPTPSLTSTSCTNATPLTQYCVNNQEVVMATAINPGSGWYAVPPTQSQSNYNQWTIVLSQKGSATTPAYYLPMFYPAGSGAGNPTGPFSSVACLKADSSESVYINDTASFAGEDVVFKNVTFLGHSRAEFRGIVGGAASGPGALTYTQKLEKPTPYNNFGVQLINFQNGLPSYPDCLQSDGGGVQIHGVNNTGPTWGNLIVNYSAYGTADDSLALFDDIGGQTVTYNVTNATPSGTFTASYPQSIIAYDPSVMVPAQSSSVTLANDFVRFIGSYITDSDILGDLQLPDALGSQVVLSNSGNWSPWSAAISTTVLDDEIGCDPAVIGASVPHTLGGAGTGCPLLSTIQATPTSPATSGGATITSPGTFIYPP